MAYRLPLTLLLVLQLLLTLWFGRGKLRFPPVAGVALAIMYIFIFYVLWR